MNNNQQYDGGLLAQHGPAMIDNGYSIIPIQVGKKAPGFDGWQKSRSNRTQLEEWLDHGHRYSGVGILTAHTPAIDIDVRDEAMSKWAEAWVIDQVGKAPVRIGRAPKRLLVFRTDEPFKKMRSGKWVDPEWGQEHQIEILGDGQQFVAFHTHPDTGKPYTWPNGDSPLNVRSPDLPELLPEQAKALCDAFDAKCSELGWTLLKGARSTVGANSTTGGEENPWVEDTSPVDMSEDELRSHLLLVPNAEDHDVWFQVGMALYHQFDGSETGREMWHEWSETADNYDRDALDRRWDSFGIEGKGRAPITARYIIRLSKDALASAAQVLAVELREEFLHAKDLTAWEKARAKTREAEIDALSRAALASLAKERRDVITGTKTPLIEIKKALSYAPKRQDKAPGWCEPWVYDVSDDRFYNLKSKISASKQGFDAMYDRRAMTKKDVLDGKSQPSQSASSLALNVFTIPTVGGRRYMPDRDEVFHEPDGVYANTYPAHEVPESPEVLKPRDKKAIARVKAHIAHLLPKEEEQVLFTDWLSWIVQNPGKHANHAVLLQGVEGDGKSFFAQMMRAVMGVSNVRMLNAHILESPFTDWAAGQCLACLEEVRLVNSKNKYEILNRMKPFITNDIVEVHPKGRAVMNVRNTTNYLFFTNFKDALPIDDDSRRYMVLFSQWQRKEALDRFKQENPTYYQDLYDTIANCAPALRHWLLHHEQSSGFNPLGDAPVTDARKYMIRQAKPEFIQVLDDLIADNEHLGVSKEMVMVAAMTEAITARGLDFPQPKALASMLQRDGYESMGLVRIGKARATVWSKYPERLQSINAGGVPATDPAKIKAFIEARRKLLDDLSDL